MNTDLSEKTKEELVVIAFSCNANLSKVSKLYLKMKAEYGYLQRRNKILEDRMDYLKGMWEKKVSCKLTFKKIDSIIRKEHKIKHREVIKFEDKNGNAKDERLQS